MSSVIDAVAGVFGRGPGQSKTKAPPTRGEAEEIHAAAAAERRRRASAYGRRSTVTGGSSGGEEGIFVKTLLGQG